MITSNQLKAARALLSISQIQLAELTGLSVPTIQRMEASDGFIRGNVDSLVKLISGIESAGIEVINEDTVSQGGGRGVRLRAKFDNDRFTQDADNGTEPGSVSKGS